MPAVVRLGDTSTGHGLFPSRPNDQGDGFFTVEGKPVHCLGHHWVTHCDPATCHDGSASSGSSFFFVKGKPICRVGDSISCGDKMGSGSGLMFVQA
jgi:uncharacterized Zn-binding protein involved in type VI secretion